MKTLRVSVALLGAAFLVLTFSGTAAAFHSGGVAECSGCHSMHSAPGPKGSFLLKNGVDKSATCLSCHESNDAVATGYHISTASVTAGLSGNIPVERTPGGDFSWVRKDYTYADTDGTMLIEKGQEHGHNIIATAFGYNVDTANPTAPGGTMNSADLSCASCHDPHGQTRRMLNNTYGTSAQLGVATLPIKASGSYSGASNEPTATEAVGVYRLLAGPLYQNGSGTVFQGVPVAKVPSTYNRSEAVTQTRAAYGVGMAAGEATWGQWCASCHPKMHSTGNYVHPIDQALGAIAANYNAYVKSGDLSGNGLKAYSSLVPFFENTNDYTALATHAKNDDTQLLGPAQADQVACLSCHRAHASGMVYGLRFDIEYEFMTKGSQYIGSDNPLIGNWSTTNTRAGVQARGRTTADWTAAYYDRPATQFATYQRVLCNKCHAKD